MPIARFQLPDGRVARFEVPEGTSPEQAQVEIEKHLASAPKAEAPKPVSQPSEADMVAGNPLTRFALGAASPFLGAAQLGAEAIGNTGVSEHLKKLEEMKKRGMSQQADLIRLKQGRQVLAQLPGYEAAVAKIDQDIASLSQETEGGVDVAGLAGTVLSPAVLGAMKLPAAGSVLGRAGQGAGVGAALGLASPVTATDDFWTAKAAQVGTGAVLGAAIPPAIEGVRKVYQVGRRIVDPMLPGGAERSAARLLSEAAGAKRPQIEAELAANKVLVPGAAPTAAEAAAPAGSAEFSAMQRIASERQPTAYADIAKEQEIARRASLQSFGKDKATLEAAQEARSVTAEKLYDAAFRSAVRADPELAQMAQNPYFKDAVPHAVKLAQAKGINPKTNLTQFLHYVKLGMDKELTKAGDTALSGTEKAAVQDVKKSLVEWLTKKNKSYDEARTAFALESKPINEMQVGQELEKALVKPIGEGERAGVFAGAMREAPRTIKKATGQSPFDELEDVLSPANLDKAKNVLADLGRKGEQERLASLGRSKAAEITQAVTLPATGPLNQQYMIFKTVLGRISKGVTEKTLDQVAEALKVPAATLRLLQRVPSQQQQAFINQIIAQKLGRGAVAAATELSGEVVQQ